MATVYEELLTAVKQENPTFSEKQSTESDGDYIKRLLKVLGTVSDAVWNAIPEPAQAWSNDAVAAISSNKACLECPGYTYTQETVVNNQPVVTDKPAEAAPKVKRPSAMQRVRQFALLNPDATPEQLLELATGEGLTCSLNSAYVCRDEVKNVLKAAKEIGFQMVNHPTPVVTEELVGASK